MSDKQKDIEDLKEVTRQAHEAIKDCRLVIRSMTAIRDELLTIAHEVFEERMDGAVKAGLEEYGKNLNVAMEQATEATYERFDRLARIMLGKGTKDDIEALVLANAPEQDSGLVIVELTT